MHEITPRCGNVLSVKCILLENLAGIVPDTYTYIYMHTHTYI